MEPKGPGTGTWSKYQLRVHHPFPETPEERQVTADPGLRFSNVSEWIIR